MRQVRVGGGAPKGGAECGAQLVQAVARVVDVRKERIEARRAQQERGAEVGETAAAAKSLTRGFVAVTLRRPGAHSASRLTPPPSRPPQQRPFVTPGATQQAKQQHGVVRPLHASAL